MQLRDVRHLTLITGHLAVTPRFAVPDVLVREIMPIVEAGSGHLPAHDLRVDYFWPDTAPGEAAGACFFQISRPEPQISHEPYVMNWSCWLEGMSEPTWKIVAQHWQRMPRALRNLPHMPDRPAVPWLASFPMPWMLEMQPLAARELGRLETALFFAAEDHDRKRI